MPTKTVTCNLCQKSMTVEIMEFDGTLADELTAMFNRMADSLVHDECLAEHEASEQAQAKRNKARYVLQSCLETGLIPSDAVECRLTKSNSDIEIRDPEYAKAYAWLRSWDKQQKHPSAWVQGTKGTGKSFFGRCWYQYVLQSTGTDAGEVAATQIHQWAIMFVQGEKNLTKFKRLGALMIDDIHIPSWNKAGVVALRDIIDYRVRYKLPTLITSNCRIEEMQTVFTRACDGDALIGNTMFDRMGGFARFTLKGESLRR